jgi:hypothetical protein
MKFGNVNLRRWATLCCGQTLFHRCWCRTTPSAPTSSLSAPLSGVPAGERNRAMTGAHVLVPDRAFVEPGEHSSDCVNDGVNRIGDLSGLVALVTAAEARISRLEKQMDPKRDRVNEARSEVDRSRGEMTDLTACADRAEQANIGRCGSPGSRTGHRGATAGPTPPTGMHGGLWRGE